MKPFLEAIDQRVLVCDGAMGTMLYAKGVFINRCFDALNLTEPSRVAEVHQDYVRAGAELLRRFSETRRRHPLAPDRPAMDGILEEREMMAPLKRWADHVIDTTETDANGLRQQIRTRFGGDEGGIPTLSVMSFGFSRGLPRNADLIFDMRYLRNPHWVRELRDLTGQDDAVSAHIVEDEAYVDSLAKIEDLILTLLPRYRAEGKAYISIGFGCTGGRHRSVHVAERVAARLREAGFSPTVEHRDLATPPRDGIERSARGRSAAGAAPDRASR